MQYGLTNSVVLQSGETGGGDIIYAKNATGNDIVSGTKVWCNQHLLTGDTEVAPYQKQERKVYNIYAWWINGIGFCYGNNAYKYQINFKYDTNSWNIITLTKSNDFNGLFKQMNGVVWVQQLYESYRFLEHGEDIKLPGNLLSDKYIVPSEGSHYLSKFDKETNTIGEASTISFNFAYNDWGIIEDNILLFYTRNNKAFTIYNISDFNNIVTLKTGTSDIFTVNQIFATGLKVGDYLIANGDGNNLGINVYGNNLLIYKIGKNFNIQYAEDLPQELQILQNTNVCAYYNYDTKILSIGTHDSLKFYEFVGGKFNPLNINFTTLPELNDDTKKYYGHLSPDKTTVCINGISGSGSWIYYSSNFYRLKVNDDSWYAEPYLLSTGQSVVGYATGNVDSDGKYEVRTVLPEEVNLTVTSTPAADSITINGEA